MKKPAKKRVNGGDIMPKKKYDYEVVTFMWNGKQYKCRGKTLEEAIEKKLNKIRALENGDVGISKNMTVHRWLLEWMETYKKGNVTDQTYQRFEGMLKNRIDPAIGSYKLKDVTDIHLQKIMNSRAGNSYDDTVKLYRFLRAAFKQARMSRLIAYDPAESIIMPKTTKGSFRSIYPSERKAILEVCKTHKAGTWIKLMLYCGLRPGETFALEWRDIDFNKKRINVSRALEAGKSREVKEPKSKAGIRSIPIPDELLQEFAKNKKGPFEPVFTQQKAPKPHTRTSGNCLWRSFKRALDIYMGAEVYRNKIVHSKVAPDLFPYCLRHTYGTDLQDAGVPINIAKYLMGHSDISVTANIYTDTTERVINEAAAKINGTEKNDIANCI